MPSLTVTYVSGLSVTDVSGSYQVPFAYYPAPEPSDREIELWYLRLAGPLTAPLIRQMRLVGPRYQRKAIKPEVLTGNL